MPAATPRVVFTTAAPVALSVMASLSIKVPVTLARLSTPVVPSSSCERMVPVASEVPPVTTSPTPKFPVCVSKCRCCPSNTSLNVSASWKVPTTESSASVPLPKALMFTTMVPVAPLVAPVTVCPTVKTAV